MVEKVEKKEVLRESSKSCCCSCCNHPIVKRVVEFYCLVWGVIGLLSLIVFIWALFSMRQGQSKWWLGRGMPISGQWQDRVIGPGRGLTLKTKMANITSDQKLCLEDAMGGERATQLITTPGLSTQEELIDIEDCLGQ